MPEKLFYRKKCHFNLTESLKSLKIDSEINNYFFSKLQLKILKIIDRSF